MKKDTVKLIGEATPEEIKEWKLKYKLGIYAVKVAGHVVYFRNPDFEDLNHIYSLEDRSHPLEMWEGAFRQTKIGGSDEPKNNAMMFMPIMRCLRNACAGLEAELVNL